MPSPYEFTAPPGETLQIGAVDAPVVGVYLSGDIQDPDGNGASPSEIESAVTHAGTTGNPHGTTAADVGADAAGAAAGAVSSHESTYAHANLPTSGQKAALAGTSGTPGATNCYVTTADVRINSNGDWFGVLSMMGLI